MTMKGQGRASLGRRSLLGAADAGRTRNDGREQGPAPLGSQPFRRLPSAPRSPLTRYDPLTTLGKFVTTKADLG